MQFSFDKDALMKEISIAQEIITNKSSLSILSNVLLIAEGATLIIKATDSAVNFTTRLPVDIREEGSVTVYCDKLMSILQSLPAGEVDMSQENSESLVILRPIGRKMKFCLKSIGADKFPAIPEAKDIPFFDVSAKDIKEMIQQTIFSVSNDINRYFMTGVYFTNVEGEEGKKLIMVSTDGRRLALSQKLIDVGDFASAIVPVKVLSCILRNASNEGVISIAVADKMIFAKFSGYEFSSMLIDGEFPGYQKVIPEVQEHSFRVLKGDIDAALHRMMIMIDKHSNRLLFTVSPGTLKIASSETEFGIADEDIPCEYDGEEVTIALNCRFIAEPLKVMDADNVVIEFTEPMKAITMKSDKSNDYFHVIMPMNVR